MRKSRRKIHILVPRNSQHRKKFKKLMKRLDKAL
jgi:hypothetical protein